jgi:hypothetical protein
MTLRKTQSGKLARNSGGSGPLKATQAQLEACCCEVECPTDCSGLPDYYHADVTTENYYDCEGTPPAGWRSFHFDSNCHRYDGDDGTLCLWEQQLWPDGWWGHRLTVSIGIDTEAKKWRVCYKYSVYTGCTVEWCILGASCDAANPKGTYSATIGPEGDQQLVTIVIGDAEW